MLHYIGLHHIYEVDPCIYSLPRPKAKNWLRSKIQTLSRNAWVFKRRCDLSWRLWNTPYITL